MLFLGLLSFEVPVALLSFPDIRERSRAVKQAPGKMQFTATINKLATRATKLFR